MKLRKIFSFTILLGFIVSNLFSNNAANANSTTSQQRKDAISFWTADRINNAIAFDMVFEKGSKVANRVPALKSSGKPSGGGTSTSVLGTSWIRGGLPLTATGKVFFKIGSSYYQCSGALVRDGKADRSIVLTAGHCVYDNATKAYATNWIFIPSYDVNQVSISGCSTTNGCWPAAALFAHSGFTNESTFSTTATLYDWGFATIAPAIDGKLPDEGNTNTDGTNSFPFSFTILSNQTQVSSFGYPASGKYKGKDLVYSSGKIGFDSNNSNKNYSLASDMTSGCSGGPWLSDMSSSSPYSGTLSSVNSYKYGTTTYIYGPIFNNETLNTYNSALALTLI